MATDVDGIVAGAKNVSEVQFTQLISYDSQGRQEYIGQAQPGSSVAASAWRIRTLLYDASSRITNIQWAGGNTKFDKVWNDRDGLSYS